MQSEIDKNQLYRNIYYSNGKFKMYYGMLYEVRSILSINTIALLTLYLSIIGILFYLGMTISAWFFAGVVIFSFFVIPSILGGNLLGCKCRGEFRQFDLDFFTHERIEDYGCEFSGDRIEDLPQVYINIIKKYNPNGGE